MQVTEHDCYAQPLPSLNTLRAPEIFSRVPCDNSMRSYLHDFQEDRNYKKASGSHMGARCAIPMGCVFFCCCDTPMQCSLLHTTSLNWPHLEGGSFILKCYRPKHKLRWYIYTNIKEFFDGSHFAHPQKSTGV